MSGPKCIRIYNNVPVAVSLDPRVDAVCLKVLHALLYLGCGNPSLLHADATIAAACHMSVGGVSKALRRLIDIGHIRVERCKPQPPYMTGRVIHLNWIEDGQYLDAITLPERRSPKYVGRPPKQGKGHPSQDEGFTPKQRKGSSSPGRGGHPSQDEGVIPARMTKNYAVGVEENNESIELESGSSVSEDNGNDPKPSEASYGAPGATLRTFTDQEAAARIGVPMDEWKALQAIGHPGPFGGKFRTDATGKPTKHYAEWKRQAQDALYKHELPRTRPYCFRVRVTADEHQESRHVPLEEVQARIGILAARLEGKMTSAELDDLKALMLEMVHKRITWAEDFRHDVYLAGEPESRTTVEKLRERVAKAKREVNPSTKWREYVKPEDTQPPAKAEPAAPVEKPEPAPAPPVYSAEEMRAAGEAKRAAIEAKHAEERARREALDAECRERVKAAMSDPKFPAPMTLQLVAGFGAGMTNRQIDEAAVALVKALDDGRSQPYYAGVLHAVSSGTLPPIAPADGLAYALTQPNENGKPLGALFVARLRDGHGYQPHARMPRRRRG